MTAAVPAVAPAGLRSRLGAWIESPRIQGFIIVLILVNAVTLGLETSARAMASWGDWLVLADRAVLGVFVVELLVKLFAFGPRFFRNPWNVFDLVVVGIALVPAAGPLSVLRALRVLRVLRLISLMPRLRFVVGALLAAVPGIGAIGGLLLLVFYVFAVIATKLFGPDFPEWFGTLGASLYSLFQIMTLESWSMGIVRPVMAVHPWAWSFFVPFILVATFTILNLFIAIIVDTMQKMHAEEKAETEQTLRAITHEEAEGLAAQIVHLRREVGELRRFLDRSSGPSA
ncbi:MAG: ion transporter [Xanthomonadales bacterium]|nr:ion transporter [Xanthomonadales bacterium]